MNSVLLSASKTREVKIGSLDDPNFFLKNHNAIQVQMIHELFISISLVSTAVKLFKIGKFTSYTFFFSIYLPSIETGELITSRVSICGK